MISSSFSRASALAAALQSHLRLIVLDLEEIDEPQAIFETLNAHGTPLLPADLIKNWLLWEAARQELKNVEDLYQTWWRPRPSPHFDATIAVGKSPALDTASANVSKSGVSRCSGMFGISS